MIVTATQFKKIDAKMLLYCCNSICIMKSDLIIIKLCCKSIVQPILLNIINILNLDACFNEYFNLNHNYADIFTGKHELPGTADFKPLYGPMLLYNEQQIIS